MSLKSLDFANDVFKLAVGGNQCHIESVQKAGSDTQRLRIILGRPDRHCERARCEAERRAAPRASQRDPRHRTEPQRRKLVVKEKLLQLFPAFGASVQNDRAADEAVLEERYLSPKRRVPIIYAVAVANLCGLWLATEGELDVGLNFPTSLIISAAVHIVHWLMAPAQLSHANMQRRLRQTTFFALVLCIGVCAWCVQLIIAADASTKMAIFLFRSFIAIGTAYGLSVRPTAPRMPIMCSRSPWPAQRWPLTLAKGRPDEG